MSGADTFFPFSGSVKGFIFVKFNGLVCIGINTDGSTWTKAGTPPYTIAAVTDSDFISTNSSYYGAQMTGTILKEGYYLGSYHEEQVKHYNVGDTMTINVGASAGGYGMVLYFGETNPFQ